MKLLFRIVIVLLIIAIVAVGGLAYYLTTNLNGLIAQYKPDLERMASESIGSTVTFGNITAKVFPQTSMVVEEVKVVDESEPDEALTLSNLALELELWPLLHKNLVIKTLSLQDPNLTLILDDHGIFLAGLPRGGETKPADTEEKPEGEVAKRAKEAMPVQVQLHNLALNNVTLTLKDTIRNKTYTVSDMNLASAIQMNERAARLTKLDVNGTALDGIDFAFNGASVLYDLSGGSVEVKEMNGNVLGNPISVQGALDPQDSSKIMEFREERTNLVSLGPAYDAFAPGLRDLRLVGEVSSTARMWLESKSSFNADAEVELQGVGATVGNLTLSKLSGPVTIGIRPDVQMAKTDKLSGSIRQAPLDMNFDFQAANNQAVMKPFHLDIFSGTADLNSTFQMDGSKAFVADAKAANMRIEEMIAALAPDLTLKLTGNVESLTGNVRGNMTDTMTQTLNGSVVLLFKDGVLDEVNVAKEALGKITQLPFIQGALLTYVPDRYQEAMLSDKTVLNEISGTFKLANEKLHTDDLYVESTYFTMESTGTIGLDSSVDLNSVIYFTKDFSDALAVSVKELQYAYDDQGRLTFPLTITGVPPDLSVRPNVSQLMKGAVKKAVVGEGLKKLLGDGNTTESTDQTGQTDQTTQTDTSEPESVEDTGKKLLQGLLNR